MTFTDDNAPNLLPTMRDLHEKITDDFVEAMNQPDAINTGGFCRLIHSWGLPEGINSKDERVIEILEKIKTEFENE